MILSSIFSSSSSVASLFPARSFESTCFAVNTHHFHCYSSHYQTAYSMTARQLWRYRPMSSAGLFGRLLMNVSNASFMALTNLSFFMKQMSMMWSTLSLKSNNSCTMVLSFSGLMTIVLPKALKLITKTTGQQNMTMTHRVWCHWAAVDGSQASTLHAVIPWYTLSSVAAGPERHSALDWRADRGERDPEFCSHPADGSSLEVSHNRKSEVRTHSTRLYQQMGVS